ncbi:type II CRISPR RNA-guided endonuclease Cas9 [Spiroplasma endosymbiont of Aspidapion aeneum]|uniref:type II CRISPR RNA-guided endonuclease Cas9 n=1 Tax=Spiroplasma endosymbiont of Aspidapion aeneum TaxID=3066276 RepID=UPI00313EEFA1
MGKKVNIGLDIGIASVGWAIIDVENLSIIKAGSRLFEEANAAKGDNQTASTRREQRSRRRILRRKITRKHDLIDLFIKYEYIKSVDDFYALNFDFDMLDKRKTALLEKIELEELLMVLFNYIKHRGTFNYKEDLSEKLKKDIIDIEEKEDRLPVDIQIEMRQKHGGYRGINTNNSLIAHDWYLKELEILLNTQVKNNVISKKFKEEYIALFNRKREYYEGPGPKDENKKNINPSPYSWSGEEEFFDRLAGRDTYNSAEQRAPKKSLTSYIFNILNDLNNLTIRREEGPLSRVEKEQIINDCIESKPKHKNITLNSIAKYINVEPNKITGYRVKPGDSSKDNFTEFESIKMIKNILIKKEKSIDFINLGNLIKIDEITSVLTKYQSVKSRYEELKELGYDFLDDETCDILATISLTGTHSLSYKTMRAQLEELWSTNKNQMEIFHENKIKPDYGIKTNITKFKSIPILRKKISDLFISPVVKRALIESIKIIKEIDTLFDFDINDIVIEMAREKNSKELKKYKDRIIKQNNEKKEKVKKDYYDGNFNDNKNSWLKFSLRNEQDGKCVYSGQAIDIERLKSDPNYCEIDHIIPFSISLDDSQTNKVLVLRKENQDKGKRTPFQYFRSIGRDFNDFKERMTILYGNKKDKYFKDKYNNLIDESELNDWKSRQKFISRNLNDTRYATTEVKNYLTHFIAELNKKWKIKTINGRFTAYIRNKVLHLEKKDRNYYSHHAKDAVVIALSPLIRINSKLRAGSLFDILDNKVERLDDYDFDSIPKANENIGTIKGDISNFDYVFTWKVRNKNNGPLFNETLYSGKIIDGQLIKIKKLDLFTTSDTKELDKLFTTDYNRLFIYKSDINTFNLLKKIYDEYSGKKTDDDKLIKNPFLYFRDVLKNDIFKVTDNDKKVLVKKLKYYDKVQTIKYFNVSHKYKKIGSEKFVFFDSGKPIGWEVFYNKKLDKYKIFPIGILGLTYGKDIDRKSQKYQDWKNKKNLTDDWIFKYHLSKYSELNFDYDGINMSYVLTGVGPEGQIEVKYINKRCLDYNSDDLKTKRIFISTNKIENLKIIVSNLTKTRYKEIDIKKI